MALDRPIPSLVPFPEVGGPEWQNSREPAGVLLVTSDLGVQQALLEPLRQAGLEVQQADGGKAALLALAGTQALGVVILDLALPDVPLQRFFSTVRTNRKLAQLPVIALTTRNSETDRIVAFELGADDLVAAPFSARELLLRIRVQLRRRTSPSAGTRVLEVGPLKLDRDSHRVWLDGQVVPLSVREFRLLEVLMERSERVLSRRLLLDLAWGTSANIGVRAVDAYVTRLRRKLGHGREYIETVSTVGYRLRRHGDSIR